VGHLDKRPDQLGIRLADVDADEPNTLVLETVGQLGQVGDTLLAGHAPRGPEFNDVHLAGLEPLDLLSLHSPRHGQRRRDGAEIEDLIISPRTGRRKADGDCVEEAKG